VLLLLLLLLLFGWLGIYLVWSLLSGHENGEQIRA
jgi:hypothetical protein